MKLWKQFVVVSVLAGIFISAGLTVAANQEEPRHGGTFRFALGVPITHLTLGKSQASIANTILRGIFENLVDRDIQGKFLPSLAKSWKVSC